jgi:NAD(P)H-flavin reductase
MDALRQQHTESIHLYHAGRTPAQLYLVDTLRALASKHDNFHYHPCAVEDDGKAGAIKTGRLEQILAHDLNRPNLAQSRIFLSGAPTFVHAARKKLYLLGARSEHIHCDPFTERVVVTV